MLAALLLLAQTSPAPVEDCSSSVGVVAQDRCELARSMRIQPAPDCADPGTQLEMNECARRDFLRTDIALNQAWDRVSKRYKGEGVFDAVLEAQRAWLTYRDRQCAVWAKLYEGGSIVPLAVLSCQAELTTARTAVLEQLLFDR